MSRTDVTAPPVPSADGLSGQFYEHCRRHQLSFQRCSRCGRWRHIPRLTCADCGSDVWLWHKSSGRGVVYSFTVIHRALHPGLKDAMPFVCAIVELDEGVRVVARVVDMAPGTALQAGAVVEVTYIDVTDDVVLPAFRLCSLTENDDD